MTSDARSDRAGLLRTLRNHKGDMSNSDPTNQPPAAGTFTGRQRRRHTRMSVRVMDVVAKYVISIGGIGVTIAFGAIVAFIVAVALPLFFEPDVSRDVSVVLPATQPATRPAKVLAMGVDEDTASAWLLDEGGLLTAHRIHGGELISAKRIVDKPITAISTSRTMTKVGGIDTLVQVLATGHADGTVRLGRISQFAEFIPAAKAPEAAKDLRPGQTMAYDGGVAIMAAGGNLRVVRVEDELAAPLKVGGGTSAVGLLDYTRTETAEKFAAMLEDGRIFMEVVRQKRNMLTNTVTTSTDELELMVPADLKGKAPRKLMLGLNGEQLYLLYTDGLLVRYNTRDMAGKEPVERVDLLPDPKLSISSAQLLLGNTTLIICDSEGGVNGWFPVQDPQDRQKMRMVKAHEFKAQDAAVSAVGISSRDRQFVTGDMKGNFVLRHMTSGTTQYATSLPDRSPITHADIAPKNDAIVVLDDQRRLTLYRMDNPHADGSMAQMFVPIHYEGYEGKQFVYQSSAGTDDAEAKISLTPLIYGTLKATIYAMLFAVPVAIMAAIYSSEFMEPRVRSVVKPLVELMASLPSVVLGFIAALVLAPMIEDVVVGVLATFVAVPLGVVAFGFVWQLLPPAITRPVPGAVKFLILLALCIASFGLAMALGPVIERVLFYGNFKGWLTRSVGTGTPGWVVLLTPLFWVTLTVMYNVYYKSRMSIYHGAVTASRLGLFEAGRIAVTGAVAIGAALLIGMALTAMGVDLRGPVVGPYVQRNSLLVGMLMGFAIIPIIYTVSEDALSSVPGSLRSASLGAGATPWQTAVRVVLPVAMSGIFSACMIGFGRAAGETMIVLMASGRTPIMDMNIFNGLSALSANIATEMPEAPVNSTHYRVLFMSALVLFAMTFIVNTIAEIVRLRFRKRAYQL